MSQIQNRVSAHKASEMCWVLAGTEDDSPNYLLYAQELADDWWELILAQITDDVSQDYFCLELEIFRSHVYSRAGKGIDKSLTYMAKDLVNDAVRVDEPTDFQEVFGGTIIEFGDKETQLWH